MEVIINFKELEDYINQNINAVSHLAGLGINSEAVETRYITLKEVLDKANELKRFVPTSESSDSEKLKSIQVYEEYKEYSYDELLKKGYRPTSKPMCGIYGIQNIVTNKWYVGQSADIYTRNLGELTDLKNNGWFNQNQKIKDDCIKHGVYTFKFFILELCKIDELTNRENFWIDAKNAIKNGYNTIYGNPINRKNKKVICITNGLIFDDIYKASDYADASFTTLRKAILKGKTCGGCLWKYEKE